MRRILLSATGVTALILATPGAALAHHRHHHFKHHARHARVNFRHVGPIAPGGPGSTPSSSPTPTMPTTTPATPTPTTEENAGKVTSYTGGVLTITLGDGSTVSGKVTINTRFKCLSSTAMQPQGHTGNEPGQGDDNGWGNGQGQGAGNQQGGPPWQNGQQGSQGGGQWQHGGGQWQHGGGEGDDDWNETPISNEPPCDSSALVEGTIVRAAELRIAPPGAAEFEWITLVR